MNINMHERTIGYYVDRLRAGERFAMAGYSDAEWYCILRYCLGKKTGLGQILDGTTGDKLLKVLQLRADDSNFLFAMPKCLWTMKDCKNAGIGDLIEGLLTNYGLDITFYERDMVTDSLASTAGLFPFIDQLKQMDVVVIGNRKLRGLDFLNYKHFVEITSPNLHLQTDGIQNAVDDAKSYGKPAVYLVSAGVSAALIISELWGQISDSFFIDCGSIWDAFVGIGGQRAWRGRLLNNPSDLAAWKRANIHGKTE
jgi:hypothetical protein